MTVQVLDLVLVALLGYMAYRAARRGFIDESLSVIGLVLAAFAMLYFGPKAAETLRHSISPHWIATVAGYGLVFLAVLLSVTFLTSWMSHNVKRSRMGSMDGILGAVFGIIKGVIIFALAFLLLCLVWSPRHHPHWMTGARLYPVIHKTADILVSLVPDPDLRRHLSPDAAPSPESSVHSVPPPTKVSHVAPPAESSPAAESRRNRKVVSPAIEDYKTVIPQERPKSSKRASQASSATKHRKAGYGTTEREALDKLIEKNGKGENGQP